MNYFEALEASVTLDEALAELARHSVPVFITDEKRLLDAETRDVIAEPDEHGEYSGEDIVSACGY